MSSSELADHWFWGRPKTTTDQMVKLGTNLIKKTAKMDLNAGQCLNINFRQDCSAHDPEQKLSITLTMFSDGDNASVDLYQFYENEHNEKRASKALAAFRLNNLTAFRLIDSIDGEDL